MPGTAAEGAGLRAADPNVRVDGGPVSNDALREAQAGTAPFKLGVRRNGQEIEIVRFAD